MEDLLISMKSFNEVIFQNYFRKIHQLERTKKPVDFGSLISELKQKLSSDRAIKMLHDINPQSRSTFANLQNISKRSIIDGT